MAEIQTGPTPTGSSNDGRILAALGYILWIVALVAYFIKPEDKYLRFHSLQAILLSVAEFVVGIGVGIFCILLVFTGIGALLVPIVWLGFLTAIFVIAVVFAVWAYQGKRTKIPIIGGIAESHA
ncbi:MAG: hypothetical protein J7L23_02025 [Candidatus Diapherotrites archaeon]|nr:hypothetical protein [Candidatus Diapherotrites archaeon]